MESERKHFKFYKSYFDVYNELSKNDKLLFIDALFKRQFYGIEPSLKGMSNFAYLSQKHNIDAQVKGYEDRMKTTLLDPIQGGVDGGGKDPSKETIINNKEQEISNKVIYPFDTENFIKFWDLWKQYKKEEYKFTYKSDISEQAALKKLGKNSDNNELIAIQIIEYSIANGYKGLFKENNYNNKKAENGATKQEIAETIYKHFGPEEK